MKKSSGTFLKDQTLAEKMSLLHIPLKSSTGRIHLNVDLKWSKKIHFLIGLCGKKSVSVLFRKQ